MQNHQVHTGCRIHCPPLSHQGVCGLQNLIKGSNRHQPQSVHPAAVWQEMQTIRPHSSFTPQTLHHHHHHHVCLLMKLEAVVKGKRSFETERGCFWLSWRLWHLLIELILDLFSLNLCSVCLKDSETEGDDSRSLSNPEVCKNRTFINNLLFQTQSENKTSSWLNEQKEETKCFVWYFVNKHVFMRKSDVFFLY